MKTYELCLRWRKEGQAVISGFHSPMEKECLRILLKGRQPIIVCPARGIWRRIPPELKNGLKNNRLLIVTPFLAHIRRMTSRTAHERNEWIVSLVDRVFISYASPGGKMETLCSETIRLGKEVLTFESNYNNNLLLLGASLLNKNMDI